MMAACNNESTLPATSTRKCKEAVKSKNEAVQQKLHTVCTEVKEPPRAPSPSHNVLLPDVADLNSVKGG
jgi:hypothetical protein